LILLLLLVAAYFLLQTSGVQNWLVKKAADKLSKDLGTN
jgi:hypothetical protein